MLIKNEYAKITQIQNLFYKLLDSLISHYKWTHIYLHKTSDIANNFSIVYTFWCSHYEKEMFNIKYFSNLTSWV